MEAAADGVPVADEEVDLLGHAVALGLEEFEERRIGVLDDDLLRPSEAREDARHDPSGNARVDQTLDLADAVDEVSVVLAIAVVETSGRDQALLLVVAKHPRCHARSLRELSDAHATSSTRMFRIESMSATDEDHLRVGIIGAGSIGSTIARRLSRHGHGVVIANPRGPETIGDASLRTGARAVSAAEAVEGVDVLVVSVPMNCNTDITDHVRSAPDGAVVIDTSNYYPARDGSVRAFEKSAPESLWSSELFGRPVAKAWNAITSQSFDAKASKAGDPARVAIPVAADRPADRAIALRLVEQTGFDAFDAGVLSESWLQQPAAPVYCTDRTLAEMRDWLAAAQNDRVPQRRDAAMSVIGGYSRAGGEVSGPVLVAIDRASYS